MDQRPKKPTGLESLRIQAGRKRDGSDIVGYESVEIKSRKAAEVESFNKFWKNKPGLMSGKLEEELWATFRERNITANPPPVTKLEVLDSDTDLTPTEVAKETVTENKTIEMDSRIKGCESIGEIFGEFDSLFIDSTERNAVIASIAKYREGKIAIENVTEKFGIRQKVAELLAKKEAKPIAKIAEPVVVDSMAENRRETQQAIALETQIKYLSETLLKSREENKLLVASEGSMETIVSYIRDYDSKIDGYVSDIGSEGLDGDKVNLLGSNELNSAIRKTVEGMKADAIEVLREKMEKETSRQGAVDAVDAGEDIPAGTSASTTIQEDDIPPMPQIIPAPIEPRIEPIRVTPIAPSLPNPRKGIFGRMGDWMRRDNEKNLQAVTDAEGVKFRTKVKNFLMERNEAAKVKAMESYELGNYFDYLALRYKSLPKVAKIGTTMTVAGIGGWAGIPALLANSALATALSTTVFSKVVASGIVAGAGIGATMGAAGNTIETRANNLLEEDISKRKSLMFAALQGLGKGAISGALAGGIFSWIGSGFVSQTVAAPVDPVSVTNPTVPTAPHLDPFGTLTGTVQLEFTGKSSVEVWKNMLNNKEIFNSMLSDLGLDKTVNLTSQQSGKLAEFIDATLRRSPNLDSDDIKTFKELLGASRSQSLDSVFRTIQDGTHKLKLPEVKGLVKLITENIGDELKRGLFLALNNKIK